MYALVEFVNSVLGDYVPVVDNLGNIPAGFSGVNWEYVCCGALLVLTVYSVFKILGGMICKIF